MSSNEEEDKTLDTDILLALLDYVVTAQEEHGVSHVAIDAEALQMILVEVLSHRDLTDSQSNHIFFATEEGLDIEIRQDKADLEDLLLDRDPNFDEEMNKLFRDIQKRRGLD